MDCTTFIERLDDLLDGRLDATARRALDEHRRGCAECATIHALAVSEAEAGPVDPPADLAARVLARTSGSPCKSARDRLPDLVDGVRGKDDSLVQMHLESCPDCSGVADALAALAVDLPVLAEPPVPADLLESVLARTSRRRPWGRRLAEGWQRLVARPRIAWEGAYLGTAVGLLIFGLPDTPLASTRRALDALTPPGVTVLEQPAARVASEARSAWTAASQRVSESGAWTRDVGRLFVGTVDRVGTSLGTLFTADASEEGTPGSDEPAGGERTTQGEER